MSFKSQKILTYMKLESITYNISSNTEIYLNNNNIKYTKEQYMNNIVLRPDAKGRLNLGEIAKNVSSYQVTIEESGRVILEPYTEIPLSDKWIFEDKALLEQIKQQIAEKECEQNK